MATHSSILAWKILWMEEHGRLQFMESQRVGHDFTTKPLLPSLPAHGNIKQNDIKSSITVFQSFLNILPNFHFSPTIYLKL